MPFRLRHTRPNPFASFMMSVVNIGMIFAPSIGYIIQANKFKSKASSKGFALYGCLVIIISNILRILFWFGKNFTKVLLYQSFVVLLSQFYLIKKYLEYSDTKGDSSAHSKDKEDNNNNTRNYLSPVFYNEIMEDLANPSLFWKWNTILHYLTSIVLIFVFCLLECSLFGFSNKKHTEFIGFLSTSIEVVLGVPQLIKNCQRKDVDTLSLIMLMTWIFGDFFKTIYYLVTKCPFQFTLCGYIQIVIDLILIGQIWYYGKKEFVSLLEEEISKDALGGGNESDNDNGNESDISTVSNNTSAYSAQNGSYGYRGNNKDDESNKLISGKGNDYGSLDDNRNIL